MALGALMLLPALPVLIALNKMGMFGGVSLGGGEEATESKEENPVEIKLTETNMKLDKLIALMGKDGIMVENLSGIKKNTGTFADGII
jgi:signal recognition particle receptor subunit beta